MGMKRRKPPELGQTVKYMNNHGDEWLEGVCDNILATMFVVDGERGRIILHTNGGSIEWRLSTES
jgi:hypothetical protein